MSFTPPAGIEFWPFLTRLGEAQILLPLALVCMLWLCLWGNQRALALRWCAAMVLATLLTLGSKIAFFGWGIGSADWDFTCFSGHAMFSASILPVLAWVAGARLGPRGQRGAAALGLLFAAAIAYSRLEVRAHSPSEALAGFLLGAAASAFALYGVQESRHAPSPWLPVGLAIWLALTPTHAPPSKTHDWVQQLSMQLSGRVPPFSRQELHWRARQAHKRLALHQCSLAPDKVCDQS